MENFKGKGVMFFQGTFYCNVLPCRDQVHPSKPGEFAFKEFDGESFVTVEPAWGQTGIRRIANVCMAEDLYKSPRDRLYRQVCKSILKAASASGDSTAQPVGMEHGQRLSFSTLKVAGDGRCGWRAILAAQNTRAFKRVPRTSAHCIHA